MEQTSPQLSNYRTFSFGSEKRRYDVLRAGRCTSHKVPVWPSGPRPGIEPILLEYRWITHPVFEMFPVYPCADFRLRSCDADALACRLRASQQLLRGAS